MGVKVRIRNASADFDIIRCPAYAMAAYPEDYFCDVAEPLADAYYVSAYADDGRVYVHNRAFIYLSGNPEKDRALKLADAVLAAGEIDLDYWSLDEYRSLPLEGRLNLEYERERRERAERIA